MTLEEWTAEFQLTVVSKLVEVDASRELRILDVGVFPWHGSIELSAFYTGDESSEDCAEDDVASWPSFNFSEQQEGSWPEIEPIAQSMNAAYEANSELAEQYFQAAASVMKTDAIRQALQNKTLADDFRITLVDPDDPDTSFI